MKKKPPSVRKGNSVQAVLISAEDQKCFNYLQLRGERNKRKRGKNKEKWLGSPAEAGGEQARLWGELGNHSSPPTGLLPFRFLCC